MATAQPGWYPDPSGDITRLRYWDGEHWTDNYTANPEQAQADYQPNQQRTGQPSPVYTGTYDQGYELSSKDSTLRLVAFVFMLLSLIATCWTIVPLIWMIPMTVHTCKLYKGKKANTVFFGVCTLIFGSLVAGILLLISEKDK